MNLLRESTFFDRDRNAQIELDDLIEETSSTADTKPTSFYLILYFSADWLPDVSNNQLNERLRSFMDTIRSKTVSSSSAVELVFVSSDKTSDSYWNFLYKFKFIRYSLAFHEKDLKTQLCNYFNVNGIPYMTLIELKLDANLKIVDFRSDKRNIKHDFLADPNALKFPWFKETTTTTTTSSQPKPTTTMTDENNETAKSSDQTAVTIKTSTDDNKTISPPVNKSKIRDINEIFEEKDDDKILYMEENEDEEDEEKNSTTASETAAENPILREIFENLEPSNEAVRLLMTTDLDRFLDEKKFIFLLVGSPQLKTNPTIVQSIAEFWKRYQKKHKFFVIYTEFNSDSTATETTQSNNNNKSSLLSVDLSNVDWFFISKMDVKINICKHYGVNSVPKLLVVDRETGDLLNNTLKMCLIEYVHEFFNSLQHNENENGESEEEEDEEEYDEHIEASSTNKQEEVKPEEPWKPPQPPPPPPPPPPVQQSVLIAKEDTTTTTTNEDSSANKGCLKSPLLWRNFNLNFDLDAYDIFDNYRHHGKSHHHRHHHHHHHHNQPHRHHRNHHRGDNTHRSAHRSRNDNSTGSTTAVAVTTTTTVSSSSRSKRKLNRCLIDELNANLIEVCPASLSTIGNVGAASQSSQLPPSKNYYLLYFCSFFTSSNGRQKALFEQIIEFLRYVQEKIECSIKIILVSSDFLETDYHKLVDKYRAVDTIPDQEHGNFGRYVLDFRSKAVKERLFQKLHVTGIPWFSLIDADSGEILCENLKIFILNSQLREMIF